MKIFETKGRLTANDSKTNIVHNFEVPENVKALKVHYEYSPKYVDDREKAKLQITDALKRYNVENSDWQEFMPVANLVTLSFDENGKYRGACHRQPNVQDIVIAEKNSTAGITNAAVQQGEWQVVLNAHYIGCDIDYVIDIEGEVQL